MATKRRTKGRGSVRQLASGRWQARYFVPDTEERIAAPTTFDTRLDAARWLADYAHGVDDIELVRTGSVKVPTFGDYALEWVANGGRRGGLKPTTEQLYRAHLRRFLLPEFADKKITRITPTDVRRWYAAMDPKSGISARQAYGLLNAIMNTAKRDLIIKDNPCTIDGAHRRYRTTGATKIATVDELQVIADNMPERYRAAVWLSSWCCLRQGEVLELRRSDLDLVRGTVTVTRGVTYVGGKFIVSTPKSAAGIRVVDIPPHIVDDLQHHLDHHTEPEADALLFPAKQGGHMRCSTLYKVFYPARDAAGRPDLRWHDLRHTGATYYGQMGATLAEIMARVGHADIKTTMIYQHATNTRARQLTDALSSLAGAVTPPESNVVTFSRTKAATR